jgi:hypothetical protein
MSGTGWALVLVTLRTLTRSSSAGHAQYYGSWLTLQEPDLRSQSLDVGRNAELRT